MTGKRVKMKKYTMLGATLAVFALLGIIESPVHGADASSFPQQIELYDVVLTYPQPAWITGDIDPEKLLDRSEFYRNHAGSQFVLEQIPVGQAFESWMSLYAVTAEEFGVRQKASMGDFIDLAAEQNGLACAEGEFGVQTLNLTETDSMLAMVCGSTAGGPTNVGYGPDVGEVSVWRFLIYEDTYVKVYQRWRGGAFGIDDRDDWPVTEAELQEMVRRMTEIIEIVPSSLAR
ncbi:MAG: hypothetical protein ABJ215_07260 [Alphaproteobacteria bacterium]